MRKLAITLAALLVAPMVQAATAPVALPEIKAAPPPPFPPAYAGAAFADGADLPEMVVIPKGSFTMGSTPEERKTLGVIAMFDHMEEPRHKVSIGYAYAVSRYAITFAQWDACVADGGCQGYRPDDAGWGRGRRPVINVNYTDALAYVAWLKQKTGKNYRLLSEAEWEYAARAGTQTWYPWGDRPDPAHANFGNNHDRTAPVGSYPPNGFGLHDMIANVAQWVADCHHDTYDGAPVDGSAWDAAQNCKLRNVRGGGWSLSPWSVRVAQRIGDPIAARNSHLGFRVARDLP